MFEEIDALKAENAELKQQTRAEAAAEDEDEMNQVMPGWHGLVLKPHPTDESKFIFTEEFQPYYDKLPRYAQKVLTEDPDATPEDYIHVIEPWYKEQKGNKPGSTNGSQPGKASESALETKRAAQRESAASPSSKSMVAPTAGTVTDKTEADEYAAGQKRAQRQLEERGRGRGRGLRRKTPTGYIEG